MLRAPEGAFTPAGESAAAPVFHLTIDGVPPGSLSVVSFEGEEEVSAPFSFRIVARLLLEGEGDLERALLARAATLTLPSTSEARAVRGVLRAVETLGTHAQGGLVLRLRVEAWLSMARDNRKSRVFQDMTVGEVVREVLRYHDIRTRSDLTATYPKRAYCVQIEESDHDFVARLLAEEGIFFCIDPRDPMTDGEAPARESVILMDDPSTYAPVQGISEVGYASGGALAASEGSVQELSYRAEVGPEAVEIRHYDYHRPLLDPVFRSFTEEPQGAGSLLGGEIYEHHPEYQEVDRLRDPSRTQLEQHRAGLATGSGEGRCPWFSPCRTFVLEGHPATHLNRPYVITRVEHHGASAEARREDAPAYRNTFRCARANVAVRPARPARQERRVVETAVVVGPRDQEIHTDALGRIKIQFHWDRDGARDERSSCFVRVAQPWAGAGWGFQFIPRIGMEVLVTFLGGDMDCPVVTGCVYNTLSPPTHALPRDATRSGIRTQSSPGGRGYNEISFEDLAEREKLHVRAQRDLEELVLQDRISRIERDDRATVLGDRVQEVRGDLSVEVKANSVDLVHGDRGRHVEGNAVDVVSGNADERVEHDRTTRIGGREIREVGRESELTAKGDRTQRIHGFHTTVVGQAGAPSASVLHVEGSSRMSSTGLTEISSDKGIVLRCGSASIRLTPGGVEIVAPSVRLSAGGAGLALGGETALLRARKKVRVRSEKILLKTDDASVKLGKNAKIDGAKVRLNCAPEPDDDLFIEDLLEPTKIRLRDQHGAPFAHERYVVVMPDGTEEGGILDAEGEDELEIEQGDEVSFPDLHDTEGD